MADRMGAEIHIGGKIPRNLATALCECINASRASLEWGGAACHFHAAEELLKACDDSPRVLKLHDDEARWGEFEDLEWFLQQHNIPYDRWGEGKYEHSAEGVAFRPGSELLRWLVDTDQRPIVPVERLTPVEAGLASLLESVPQGQLEIADVTAQIVAVHEALCAVLPPHVPPLDPFNIVEDAADANLEMP